MSIRDPKIQDMVAKTMALLKLRDVVPPHERSIIEVGIVFLRDQLASMSRDARITWRVV